MEWSGRAILLSLSRHGEHAAIGRMLTDEHGLCAALIHGAYSRDKRGLFQTGNLLQASWRARTSDQLGTLKQADITLSTAALVMQRADKLQALASACALTESCLAEHHPEPLLFQRLSRWLETLPHNVHWREEYVRYELALLTLCGYGLDLECCAVTGEMGGLAYVSPKSGRAVTRIGAGPYRDMLLPLPRFIRNPHAHADPGDIISGLKLTSHFLRQSIFSPRGKSLPMARKQLEHLLCA